MHNDLQNDVTPSAGINAACTPSNGREISAQSHELTPSKAGTPKTGSRPGAPRGNSNRTSHGMKGSKLPPGCRADEGKIHQDVRRIKAEYEAKHGPMGTHADAILHRIRRALTRDRLAARWLRKEAEKLTIEQRLALTGEMAAAAETIEKCVRQLGLDADSDRDHHDPLAALAEFANGADTPPRSPEKPLAASPPSCVVASDKPAQMPP
jgi:hypothetical protein